MKYFIITFLALSVLLIAGCKTSTKNPSDQQVQKKQFEVTQDSIDQLVKATEEKFRAMNTEQLISELEQSALKGREPFNSASFREIIKRKDAAEPLYKSITDSTQKEYFKLMALQKIDKELYTKIKPANGAAILTDALAKSEVFNAWGLPNEYWESSARAIIDYQTAAVKYLERLLDDKRDAPVWGSEEAAIYQQYKFRVCDYALALLYTMKQKRDLLPVSPRERDTLIEAYKKDKK
ncbi:MAG TPA: hypothetical protein VIN08_11675 [Ohtaekwangia sp.]|uniref:hypothetical protein n=1 Tax=Ohtaekwangia sp. TaxID=2066019 RepID=UPI002F941D61